MLVPFAAAAEIGDPEGTRTVYAIVALLVVLGIALVMLAVWMWRVTRPDPELLAPLEVMGERTWRRADPMGQRRRLDQVRPESASPLQRPSAAPVLDESFDAGPSAIGVSDLREFAMEGDPARGGASGPDGDADDQRLDDADDGDGGDTGDGDGDGGDGGDGGDDRGGDEVRATGQGDEPAPRDGTPVSAKQPLVDDLDEVGAGHLDDELLAEAAAELDREIGGADRET